MTSFPMRGPRALDRRARLLPLLPPLLLLAALVTVAGMPTEALAHGMAAGDKGYLQELSGVLLIPFAYLGAKHMVTGYDHLLFRSASSSSCTA